jgi:3-deoxy-D-manno-octulosonic-acid transferase
MNRTLYTALFYLGLPLVAIRLWLRARKAPAYAKRIGERFSYGMPVMKPGGIWVHAVSVGESIAAAPMIRALLQRYPTSADHRDLHDADRFGAHPGVVRQRAAHPALLFAV